MGYSLFALTIGEYLPFSIGDSNLRDKYYLVVFLILVTTVIVVTFKMYVDWQKSNLLSSCLIVLFFGVLTFVFFGNWTLGILLRS